MGRFDDYRYSEDARVHDLKIIWECDTCHRKREDYPGMNEGGACSCGGTYIEAGESHAG